MPLDFEIDSKMPLGMGVSSSAAIEVAGYNRMGLGSSETDAMVAAVVDLGPAHGFYGARISGGGSGGTVVVLLEETSLPRLRGAAIEVRNAASGDGRVTNRTANEA